MENHVSGPVSEGDLLWTPPPDRVARSALARFLADNGVTSRDTQDVWRWSVDDLDRFWDAVWRFGAVIGERGGGPALADAQLPGARWYPQARLNYAENALERSWPEGRAAFVAVREDGRRVELTPAQLRQSVARAAQGMRRLGVGPSDRVAAVLPNAEHAAIAFLAAASIGAVWSSCSPDFGPTGILDRFQQIEPTLLLVVDGYRYNGRTHDVRPTLAALRAGLPTLTATVVVPYLDLETVTLPDLEGGAGQVVSWDDLVQGSSPDVEPRYERLPFDAPLWILYSSGTTGRPKPIVHGHGGIVLEHLKQLSLHVDLGPDDVFFWFSTTGWMMWNLLLGGLLVGCTVLAFDGSPGYPDLGALWRLAEREQVTAFGTSAPFIISCMNAGILPREEADLSRVRTVGSTGAPLPPEGFNWVYEAVGDDLLLASISGGTDVCSAFAVSSPLAPVYAGEIQTRAFGVAMAAFDEQGHEVLDLVGELVVTAPMPSMPVSFWGDPAAAGDRVGPVYQAAYFDTYPGVWRHGDWCRVISARGSVVISGRSDATLNRGGVRLGTAEFYRVVNAIPEVDDSLVVDVDDALLLFVTLVPEARLDPDLVSRIRGALRSELSPRHVPDQIEVVPDLPRTLNGKKLEVPVKRILLGHPLDRAVTTSAVANPEALAAFVELADRRSGSDQPG